MTSSVVDICNEALSHTGTDAFINSLDEQSKEAKLCSRWYETTRDQILRTFAWNFAQRRVVLADMGDPPTGYRYRYRYPVDALMIQRVYPAGEWSPSIGHAQEFERLNSWEVASSGDGGRVILTNIENAEAVFTVRVVDPNLFDPLFQMSLAFKLAANIAMPLVSNPEIVEYLRNKTRESMSEALQVNLSEAQEPPALEAESVRARFGTLSDGRGGYVDAY